MTEQEKIIALQSFIEDNCKYVFDYFDPDRIPIIKLFLTGALRSAFILGNIETYTDTDSIRLFFDAVDNAAERSIIHRVKNAISEEVE